MVTDCMTKDPVLIVARKLKERKQARVPISPTEVIVSVVSITCTKPHLLKFPSSPFSSNSYEYINLDRH